MNPELKLLVDVLWVGLLLSLAGGTFLCAALYGFEGAKVMAVTGTLLCVFFLVQAYKYSKEQGYLGE